jgi:hypothetical protein
MGDDPGTEAKFWAWTQHGDAEYMFAAGGSLEEAVQRFSADHRVAHGTTVYAVSAEAVEAFVVKAVPRD